MVRKLHGWITYVAMAGVFLHSVDRFNEDGEGQVIEVDRLNATPLLEPRVPETGDSSASWSSSRVV